MVIAKVCHATIKRVVWQYRGLYMVVWPYTGIIPGMNIYRDDFCKVLCVGSSEMGVHQPLTLHDTFLGTPVMTRHLRRLLWAHHFL